MIARIFRISIVALALAAGLTPLQLFGSGTWQQIREAHAGRPLVVHFWGLTCAPCLAELPGWGRLFAERPGADMVFVAADSRMQEPALVSSMLANAGLSGAENWMFVATASSIGLSSRSIPNGKANCRSQSSSPATARRRRSLAPSISPRSARGSIDTHADAPPLTAAAARRCPSAAFSSGWLQPS